MHIHVEIRRPSHYSYGPQRLLVPRVILDFSFGAVIHVPGIYYTLAIKQSRMASDSDRARS
jgi:hypothetical protein